MKPLSSRRQFLAGLAFFACLPAWPAEAKRGRKGRRRRGRRGHDDAYSQRKSGKILALSVILAKLQPQISGEIIDTEFEVKQGTPVYEFKVISPTGTVSEVYVNAHTGKIISRKTKH